MKRYLALLFFCHPSSKNLLESTYWRTTRPRSTYTVKIDRAMHILLFAQGMIMNFNVIAGMAVERMETISREQSFSLLLVIKPFRIKLANFPKFCSDPHATKDLEKLFVSNTSSTRLSEGRWLLRSKISFPMKRDLFVTLTAASTPFRKPVGKRGIVWICLRASRLGIGGDSHSLKLRWFKMHRKHLWDDK